MPLSSTFGCEETAHTSTVDRLHNIQNKVLGMLRFQYRLKLGLLLEIPAYDRQIEQYFL